MVEVWHALVPETLDAVEARRGTLDEGERRRASRFRFERDAQLFSLAHTLMRDVLGARLGTPPGELRFEATQSGKPVLAGGRGVGFSLSHADQLAVCAVASDEHRLGIDAEPVTARPGVGRLVFSDTEQRALAAMSRQRRERAAVWSWVAKEAVLKAAGVGLRVAPSRVPVAPNPDGPAGAATIDGACWRFAPLGLRDGYVAALAREAGGPVTVREWVPS